MLLVAVPSALQAGLEVKSVLEVERCRRKACGRAWPRRHDARPECAGPAGTAPTWTGARFSHRGMEIETSTGPIPIIRSVSVDTTDFSLRLHAADDSTLRISLLPLFEAYHSQTTGR
jgi:hypothetical protein